MKDPRTQLAGVQKAPRHEVAGSWAAVMQTHASQQRPYSITAFHERKQVRRDLEAHRLRDTEVDHE